MTLSQRFNKIILAALSLSIAVPIALQSFNRGLGAVAAEGQTQSVEGRSPLSIEETYITCLFDLSGRQLAQFEGRLYGFNPDGQRLLTVSDAIPFPINLFDVSGKKLLQFDAGEYITTLTNDRIHLFDRSGKKLLEITGQDAVFSPDGQTFAVTEYRSP